VARSSEGSRTSMRRVEGGWVVLRVWIWVVGGVSEGWGGGVGMGVTSSKV